MNKLSFFLLTSLLIASISYGQNPAAKCADALAHEIIIPYSSSNDSTCHLGNDFMDANTVPCGNTNFLGGEDRLYVFTANVSGNIQVRVNTTTEWIGIFAYIGCPSNGICVGTHGDQSGIENLTFYAIAGITYYVVIDTWSLPYCIPSYNIYIGTPSLPTHQDCLGAIPITSCIYTQYDTLHGTGLIPNEIDTTISCLKHGEQNSMWYTFTVQQSGNLNFLITPFTWDNDNDWALYNITNKPCDSIYYLPSMLVSCNQSYWTGATGPNGGSSFNYQGNLGSAFNAEVPVLAGETYALIVNYEDINVYVRTGYTINFCQSTAVLFDSIPPKLKLIVAGNSCNSDSLKIKFSEKVQCGSVECSDFALTGPGGPYTITAVHSLVCDTNGHGDSTFVLSVTPHLMGGTYHLIFDGTILDLHNIPFVIPYDKPFYVSSFTAAETIASAPCNSPTGSVTIAPNGGTGPYTYNWSPPAGNNYYLVNAASGIYYLTIIDANGCRLDTTVIIGNDSGLVATARDTNVSCHWGNDGKAFVTSVAGGNAPYSYLWSSSAVTNDSITNLAAGTYFCTVTDASGCRFVTQSIITEPDLLSANAGTNQSICFGSGLLLGALNPAAGGTPPYTYLWNPNNTLNDSTVAHPMASPTVATSYTLTVKDAKGCMAFSTAVAIGINPLPSTPVVTVNGSQLTSSAALNYQWCFNGVPVTGSTNQTFTIGAFGAYTVIVTDANGCSAVSLPYGFVGIPTIQNEPPRFSLFPNPSNGRVEIGFSITKPQHFVFSVYDLAGREVYVDRRTIGEGKYSQGFDFSRLAKGIYTFRLVSEGYNTVRKIVVE